MKKLFFPILIIIALGVVTAFLFFVKLDIKNNQDEIEPVSSNSNHLLSQIPVRMESEVEDEVIVPEIQDHDLYLYGFDVHSERIDGNLSKTYLWYQGEKVFEEPLSELYEPRVDAQFDNTDKDFASLVVFEQDEFFDIYLVSAVGCGGCTWFQDWFLRIDRSLDSIEIVKLDEENLPVFLSAAMNNFSLFSPDRSQIAMPNYVYDCSHNEGVDELLQESCQITGEEVWAYDFKTQEEILFQTIPGGMTVRDIRYGWGDFYQEAVHWDEETGYLIVNPIEKEVDQMILWSAHESRVGDYLLDENGFLRYQDQKLLDQSLVDLIQPSKNEGGDEGFELSDLTYQDGDYLEIYLFASQGCGGCGLYLPSYLLIHMLDYSVEIMELDEAGLSNFLSNGTPLLDLPSPDGSQLAMGIIKLTDANDSSDYVDEEVWIYDLANKTERLVEKIPLEQAVIWVGPSSEIISTALYWDQDSEELIIDPVSETDDYEKYRDIFQNK
ncbi:MAG: hypothetical protein ABIH67_01085 [Candidatus Uhrbacteria bacterium]